MKLLKVLLLVAGLLSINAMAYNPLDGVKAQKAEAAKYVKNFVTVKELKEWMKSGKDFQIVDVRELSERNAGQIACKRTLDVPRGVLYAKVKKGVLKPNKRYVMVCRTGHRALLAAAVLNRWYKFKNVYVLKGGIKAWIKAGGSIKNGLHLGNITINLKK